MMTSRLCLRAAARPTPTARPATCIGLRASLSAAWPGTRVFASTPQHRKADNASRVQVVQGEKHAKQLPKENAKPESMDKEQPAEPTQNDPLLAEQTKSNKEQRKADWRIIKDMSQYLWPKDDMGTRLRVGLSVALLIGAKVRNILLASPLSIVVHPHVDSQAVLYRSSTSKSHSTSNPSWTA